MKFGNSTRKSTPPRFFADSESQVSGFLSDICCKLLGVSGDLQTILYHSMNAG